MAVNLRHFFFAAQAVAPGMKKAGGGSIINLGSVSWHSAIADLSLYETAKAGIEGMTRALARDLGEANIRVNCVVPGRHPYTPPNEALAHAGRRGQDPRAAVPQGARRSGTCHRHGAVPRIQRCRVCALRTITGSTRATARTPMSRIECVWPVGAVLGEGPVWSAAEQAVWFVDIKAPAIHRFHPASGATRTWPAPARVGFVLPTTRRLDDCRAQDRPAFSSTRRPAISRCCMSSNRTLPTTGSTTASSTPRASCGSVRWTTTKKIRAARCTSW